LPTLKSDELSMAEELLDIGQAHTKALQDARDYAKERKLNEVETRWPERVEALSKAASLVREATALVERAFS